jgi:hypothetical protein
VAVGLRTFIFLCCLQRWKEFSQARPPCALGPTGTKGFPSLVLLSTFVFWLLLPALVSPDGDSQACVVKGSTQVWVNSSALVSLHQRQGGSQENFSKSYLLLAGSWSNLHIFAFLGDVRGIYIPFWGGTCLPGLPTVILGIRKWGVWWFSPLDGGLRVLPVCYFSNPVVPKKFVFLQSVRVFFGCLLCVDLLLLLLVWCFSLFVFVTVVHNIICLLCCN